MRPQPAARLKAWGMWRSQPVISASGKASASIYGWSVRFRSLSQGCSGSQRLRPRWPASRVFGNLALDHGIVIIGLSGAAEFFSHKAFFGYEFIDYSLKIGQMRTISYCQSLDSLAALPCAQLVFGGMMRSAVPTIAVSHMAPQASPALSTASSSARRPSMSRAGRVRENLR